MVHGILRLEDTQKPKVNLGGPFSCPAEGHIRAGSARAPCEVRRRLLGFTPTVNPLWMPFLLYQDRGRRGSYPLGIQELASILLPPRPRPAVPHHLIPDHEYQEQEIARVYATSGRCTTYVGDWHSHPGGALYLSRTDVRTAGAIGMLP